MAIWYLQHQGDGHLGLTYKNQSTDSLFLCGSLLASTPRVLVLAWILSQDAAQPLDWIHLENGEVLLVLPQPPVRV
jgi:hypothetical protein